MSLINSHYSCQSERNHMERQSSHYPGIFPYFFINNELNEGKDFNLSFVRRKFKYQNQPLVFTDLRGGV